MSTTVMMVQPASGLLPFQAVSPFRHQHALGLQSMPLHPTPHLHPHLRRCRQRHRLQVHPPSFLAFQHAVISSSQLVRSQPTASSAFPRARVSRLVHAKRATAAAMATPSSRWLIQAAGLWFSMTTALQQLGVGCAATWSSVTTRLHQRALCFASRATPSAMQPVEAGLLTHMRLCRRLAAAV